MSKYEIKHTTQFKKDYKLAKRRGLNIDLLKNVISKLSNGETLEAKYKDHPLSGDWIGHRECHIQPDWLLIVKFLFPQAPQTAPYKAYSKHPFSP